MASFRKEILGQIERIDTGRIFTFRDLSFETETANRVRSGYRYGCGYLFGQPHFVIDVSTSDLAVQFFSQVAELFILIDRQLSQSQH